MRQSRLTKFKRKKVGKFIVIQSFVLFYLGTYGLVQFTSSTNAAFNDIERLILSLKADNEFEPPEDEEDDREWDKSSLEFKGQASHCQNGTISAVIQNGSSSRGMKGPVVYEVYWTEKGNPKPDKGGVIVANGQVPPLSSGESFEMFYTPTEPGNYMFRALQRPGHPGKGELWSEVIKVEQKCIPKQPKMIENQESKSIDVEQNETNNKQKNEEEENQTPNKQNKQTKQLQPQELENKENENREVSNQSSSEKHEKKETKGADHLNENNVEMD